MLGRGFLARTPPPSPIRRDLDASAHQQDDRRTAGKHGETQVALVPSTLGIQLDSQRSGHIACRHDPFACLHALCEGIATSPGEIVGSVAIKGGTYVNQRCNCGPGCYQGNVPEQTMHDGLRRKGPAAASRIALKLRAQGPVAQGGGAADKEASQ